MQLIIITALIFLVHTTSLGMLTIPNRNTGHGFRYSPHVQFKNEAQMIAFKQAQRKGFEQFVKRLEKEKAELEKKQSDFFSLQVPHDVRLKIFNDSCLDCNDLVHVQISCTTFKRDLDNKPTIMNAKMKDEITRLKNNLSKVHIQPQLITTTLDLQDILTLRLQEPKEKEERGRRLPMYLNNSPKDLSLSQWPPSLFDQPMMSEQEREQFEETMKFLKERLSGDPSPFFTLPSA